MHTECRSGVSLGASWKVLQRRKPLSWTLGFELMGLKERAFPAEGTAWAKAWRQAQVEFYSEKGSGGDEWLVKGLEWPAEESALASE